MNLYDHSKKMTGTLEGPIGLNDRIEKFKGHKYWFEYR